MIHFENQSKAIFAVQTQGEISAQDYFKIKLAFADSIKLKTTSTDFLVSPAAMVTP
jgi:phosphoribosylformylglycinamidine synthase